MLSKDSSAATSSGGVGRGDPVINSDAAPALPDEFVFNRKTSLAR